MERTEPALVPGWLVKNSGSVNTTVAHQFASSSLHSDDQAVSKPIARNKSLVSSSDSDSGRPSVSDRTTSSYFRRTSNSNGSSHLRSYSSFGRTHRDRDWDKDIYDFRDKEKSVLGDNRHRDYSDPLGNILPSRFEKDVLRRSHSSVSGKRSEPLPRKVAADLNNSSKNNLNNGNVVLSGVSSVSSVHKAAFERDFPSLGAEEKQADAEIGRVPSPGLSMAIQSLPIGNSAVIGGDAWTSALAEVPVIVGTANGTTASSAQQSVNSSSVPLAPIVTTGRNMAETLAQGPPRTQAAPQVSVGTQRLEELAVKQSRQLIPMTPSMPKALNLNSLEKPKPKIAQLQHQNSHLGNLSPRGAPLKPDLSKASSMGKLQVLKPARERNGITPITKDNLSPTSGSKLPNSPLALSSVVGTAPLRGSTSNPVLTNAERKPIAPILEKRPTSQAQSRNDFFNLVRKKSMTNSASAVPDVSRSGSTSAEPDAPVNPGKDDQLVESSRVDQQFHENKVDLTSCNGDAYDGSEESFNNGKNHSSSEGHPYSDEEGVDFSEEEVALLRLMGWDENAGEDEGLTEEEISSFLSKHLHLGKRVFRRVQPKGLDETENGYNGDILSDSKLES